MDSLFSLLQNATEHVEKLLRDALEGFNPIDAVVLQWLLEEDGRSAGELARLIGRPTTSFTPYLDRLAGAGCIERRPHETDRRAIRVYLTQHGRSQALAMAERILAVEKRVSDSLKLNTALFQCALTNITEIER